MSFHWNPSSDEEEGGGLEGLWKRAANNDRNSQEDGASDDDNRQAHNDGVFLFGSPERNPVAALPSGFGDWGDCDDNNEGGSDDGDSVDWEEDHDGGDEEEDAKPTADSTPTLKAVTIDLDSKPLAKEDNKVKRKPKSRRNYRHASLPQHLRDLLNHLHQTHLLALTSHAFYVSGCCSDETALAAALSLIPPIWWKWNHDRSRKGEEAVPSHHCPTIGQVMDFCSWFSDLVQHTEERRRDAVRANLAAGAPRPARSFRRSRGMGKFRNNKKRGSSSPQSPSLTNPDTRLSVERLLQYCFYLSPIHDEDPQLLESMNSTCTEWPSMGKTALFISMARSLGWRARFVVTAEPIRKDLNVDHPIFMTAVRSVFHQLSSSAVNNANDKKRSANKDNSTKPKKRNRKEKDHATTSNSHSTIDSSTCIVSPAEETLLGCWVEILCHEADENPSKRGKKGTGIEGNPVRWVHVDPLREIIDNPQSVEADLPKPENRDSRKASRGSKGRPIAYALAAEHYSEAEECQSNCQDDLVILKRITDVTPRYSQSMVETLKLRGQSPKQLLSNWKSDWWAMTVKLLNRTFREEASPSRNQTRPSQTAAAEQRSGGSSGYVIDVDDKSPIVLDSGTDDGKSDESESADHTDKLEQAELKRSAKSEAIPTSKAKFKNHPLYVIASVLKATEVLSPDAKKRVCGVFKGELVYSRNDVSEALAAKKWLYQGRRVLQREMSKPVKRVKARAKSAGKASFKALKSYGVGKGNDGSAETEQRQLELASKPLEDKTHVDLYGVWQTEKWKPDYVGPQDPIPVNEYNNVELALLNPGLSHVADPRVANVAKKLGIPYAPCLLGFEGHNGNRTPTIRGIVVHNHNATLLREASVEVASQAIEDEHKNRQKEIYKKWKQLIVGVLTKSRLDREYGPE